MKKPITVSEIKADKLKTILQFQKKYGNYRQDLALRKMQGEKLSTKESQVLQALNKKLISVMPSESEKSQIKTLKKFLK